MKKNRLFVMLLIMSLMLMTLTACGGSDSSEPAGEDGIDTETTETIDTESEDSESADEEAADSGDSDDGVLSPEFKKTMDDYEAWFDHYCEVMKKYEENPSDLELLSEMTDLLTEETEMLEQMENMDESEMNTAELAYYIEVTARIEKKLLEVAG